MVMSYDPAKRRSNLSKHGIDLADCDKVFDRPMLTRADDREYHEERLISLCWLNDQVVTLIWTDRDEGPRYISCREANRYEREAYFQAFPSH